MPVITKCPRCGFEGNHGFTMVFPHTMYYHHTPIGAGPYGAGSCSWYEVQLAGGPVVCFSREEAVKLVHKTNPGRYDKLWLGYMLKGRKSKIGREYIKRLNQ